MLTYFIRLLVLITFSLNAQTIERLRGEISEILSSKNAVVGVSIIGIEGNDTLSINGNKHFPMQSVFKVHVGLTMLSEVDKGNFSLDQKIKIDKNDLLPGLYSPIREKYPDGVTLTLSEIMEFTISQSDNIGCDILLKLLGGPQTVENYFIANGFDEISIKLNEEIMQSSWDLQFQNWTTPNAANQVLHSFYFNNEQLLTPSSHNFFWKLMRETITGKNRLRGLLPDETKVAHKTGWSGKNKITGMSAAVNDIGIIFLSDQTPIFISVFITDSNEDLTIEEKTIAEIAYVVWKHFQ